VPLDFRLPSEANEASREDDVLGRLLGWSSTPAPARRTSLLKATPGSVGSLDGRKTSSLDGDDTEGLPSDLVAELSSAPPQTPPRARDSHTQLRKRRNMFAPIDTNVSRSPTASRGPQLSPFGDGVRLAYSDKVTTTGASPLTPSKPSPSEPLPPPSMREAPSSDSIRTEKPKEVDDDVPRRFADATIYDVLQSLENPTTASGQAPHRFTHERLASTSSGASSLSNSSQATAHQITVFSAPGDDPRFVLWGHKHTPQTQHRTAAAAEDEPSPSSPATSTKRWSTRKGSTDLSASSGSAGRRGSVASSIAPRVLMAATIERWVAELTSKLDSDLLADFFLTYRSFLSPLALCTLLITRFEWALANPTSPEDEAGRRIVRVRTYVVIRHWLLNYFVEDFVPERKLRAMLTTWLNDTSKHPKVRESPKDHQLFKNLKKVVRRLKSAYSTVGPTPGKDVAQVLGKTGKIPPNTQTLGPPSSASQADAVGGEPRKSDVTDSEVDVIRLIFFFFVSGN
jgi:GDP/GTP exchange factor required for growth at low temperature